MPRPTVFTSSRIQAVRLPNAVASPGDVSESGHVKVAHDRLISPAGRSWDEFFDGPGASDDFMRSREQPAAVERESF